MTKKSEKLAEQESARDRLLSMLSPGDTVYTILRHVSRSGMMRHISLKACIDGELVDITWYAAKLMDEKRADNGGIKVGGCGVDMGFNLVYNLGHALWPNGTDKPHSTRNGEPDYSGGYALNQQWA